jgi:hypothetical protein
VSRCRLTKPRKKRLWICLLEFKSTSLPHCPMCAHKHVRSSQVIINSQYCRDFCQKVKNIYTFFSSVRFQLCRNPEPRLSLSSCTPKNHEESLTVKHCRQIPAVYFNHFPDTGRCDIARYQMKHGDVIPPTERSDCWVSTL